MTPERWQQIEELYHAALELDPAARADFLAQACGGDAELRRETVSLLASHDQAASFIESSPDDFVAGMMAEDQSRTMIGRTLGHYRISSLLGAGGMGEVYKARDLRLDRDVAVKILPEHLATDAEALRRFEREAKAVAALSHPNILSIFDFGTEDGLSYAVMELLEGETLRGRLQRGAMGWREAVNVGSAVADGLSAAHAKNIIHRDLKPENLFLTGEGQIKILDFGIARVKRTVKPDSETLTSPSDTTRPGLVMGTLGYMSPEQVRGKAVEAPSDIFSLGCVLYEMVAGERPFAGETGAEVIAAILKEDPPRLAESVKDVPPELERIINHCLEKQPEQRFQSARELTADLRTMLGGSGQLTSPPMSKRRRFSQMAPGVGIRSTAAILWIGVAVFILLIGWAALFYLPGIQERPIDTLAILPLVNASGDANLEYLSDGITDSLINNLSQLLQLRVMARGTVFSYKGKEVDPRKVGEELKVRAVFTGRMVQRGDTLTIQADLVNASDGS
ncbi:MAG: serine/threonine-protein kinase, partial [Acidobacteriota bacterium]